MIENFGLSIINKNEEKEKQKLIKSNEILNKYGLKLSEKDIIEIVQKRTNSLKETGRIELGDWILEKIIEKFCDSQYVNSENFLNTILELIDIFYYYKNETKELVTDDELIDFMRKYYDELACGDLNYLSSTILEKMKRNVIRK